MFDATGFVYFLVAFVSIGLIWALGEGPEAWQAAVSRLSHPLYIAFHALALLSVIFVAVRFFSLFPKTQPFRLGPFQRPADGPKLQDRRR